MKNLKVFDLKNNPLDCNDDFKNLMKFLGSRKVRKGQLKSFDKKSFHQILDKSWQLEQLRRIGRNESCVL